MRQPSAAPLLLLLCIAAAAGVARAFFLLPTTSTSTARRACSMSMQAERAQPPRAAAAAVDRRGALVQGLALPLLAGAALGTLAPGRPTPALAAAKGASGPSFEETLVTLLMAKEVLRPVKRYIEIGQFDPARSNIKYVVNQFRIKKAMERGVLLGLERDVDPSKLDEAAEMTAVIDNELTQLDSSVYTQIFIPSDGELNPAAFKYRDQAFGYYDTVMKSLDAVLALATPAELAAADKTVAGKLPALKAEAPFLFKEFAGDFYRPATP